MKNLFVIIMLAALHTGASAQCIPNAATGTPGLSPAPSAIPCIERGVFYDYTIHLENFDTLTCSILGMVAVTSATIDSITNFPCGITWQADKPSYANGETGCIRVFGTTTDPVGEYPLNVYMTFVFAGQTVSGRLADLHQQMQGLCTMPVIDVNYYSRVVDAGNSCPSIGTLPSGTACSPGSLGVSISGNAALCAGDSLTLTANAINTSGAVTYAWNPGGATSQSITVSPTTLTTYSVIATDSSGSATTSVTVNVSQQPNAAFTTFLSGAGVSFGHTSTNANSYLWDFGDNQTSAAITPQGHYYSNNGTYTITLIATNACGNDTATQQVTITGAPNVCTPNAPTGTPGITPLPDAVPCIERGVPYDFTMHFEMFDSVPTPFQTVYLDFATVDSMLNFPCGITWQADKPIYYAGETGCVRVTGTSYQAPGQYPLKVYMGGVVGGFPLPGFDLTMLMAGTGDSTDYKYVSRVINTGDLCPARDTTPNIVGQPTVAITVSCAGAGITLDATPGFAQYDWSTGGTGSSIGVSAAGVYSVAVTDSSGCSGSASFTVTTTPLPAPEICIVGVDSATGKNIIVWEKPTTAAIDSYIVYRETNQTGVYAAIGTQAFGDFSTFIDNQSVPEQNSNKYLLGVIDSCGLEIQGTQAHTTIHLSINQGVGSVWNLNWSNYEGFSFSTYNIYRGTSAANLTLINSVASNVNSYTDLNPPAGSIIYYQIEAVNPSGCIPSKRSGFGSSRSNIVSTPFTGIGDITSEPLRMYPNPFTESVTVDLPESGGTFDLRVLDVAGRELLSRNGISGRTYIIERDTLPKGIFYIELRGEGGMYRGKVVGL